MSHISVLLHETVDGVLAGRDTGIFVDATFGRGGHTKLLLSKLDQNARVYAFDKDPQALAVAAQLEQEDSRFKIIHASFADLQAELAKIGITEVDGIMADLGVSSPQLDQAERGFSFMQNGPLDMRMDNSQGLTAAEWLLKIEEEKFKQQEVIKAKAVVTGPKTIGKIDLNTKKEPKNEIKEESKPEINSLKEENEKAFISNEISQTITSENNTDLKQSNVQDSSNSEIKILNDWISAGGDFNKKILDYVG